MIQSWSNVYVDWKILGPGQYVTLVLDYSLLEITNPSLRIIFDGSKSWIQREVC